MNKDKITHAEIEATLFLDALRRVRVRLEKDPDAIYRCKEVAAMRRASMDLSRALSELRASL
jgi:hypothetical protein